MNIDQFMCVPFWFWGWDVGFDCINSLSLPYYLLSKPKRGLLLKDLARREAFFMPLKKLYLNSPSVDALSVSCLSNNIKTNKAILMKLHRKIKHNEKAFERNQKSNCTLNCVSEITDKLLKQI